jgi:TonB family protein
MKNLLYLLLILIVVTSCRQKPKEIGTILIGSQEEATNDSSFHQTEVFSVIEEMPKFGNGRQEDIIRYFQQNTDYPASAIRDSIQGRVIVSFTIDEKGKVCNPRIMRGVRSDIDDECLRVVGNMPRWIPGNMRGKPIRVHYSVPLSFILKDNPNQKGIIIKPKSSDKQELNCKIYPNPAHDHLSIRIEDQDIQVRFQIVNSSGQIVTDGLLNESIEQIDISQLTNGIYFLNLTTVDNLRSSVEKFIKN